MNRRATLMAGLRRPVLAFLLAGGVVVTLAAGGTGSTLAAPAGTAGTASAAPAAAPGLLAGTWTRLAAAPITTLPDPNISTSVWTGRVMIIRADRFIAGHIRGFTYAYRPASNTWATLARGPKPLDAQLSDVALWTGSEVLVFGLTSAAYNPVTNAWHPIVRPNLAPSGIIGWTGREAIFWDGTCCGNETDSGAAYNPATSKWRTITSPLDRRAEAIGAWTGKELVVAGGLSQLAGGTPRYFRDSAGYNPATRMWRKLATMPLGRYGATAVWDGKEILFLGGRTANRLAVRGMAYNPASNRWRWLPEMVYPRRGFAAVWTGRDVLVWGGLTAAGTPPPHGEAYNPATNRWTALPASPLHGRVVSAAAWTGRRMIVWGGYTVGKNAMDFLDGAAFRPSISG